MDIEKLAITSASTLNTRHQNTMLMAKGRQQNTSNISGSHRQNKGRKQNSILQNLYAISIRNMLNI
jgi:hypothetical protein